MSDNILIGTDIDMNEKKLAPGSSSPSFRAWCAPILIVWIFSALLSIFILEFHGFSLLSFIDVSENDDLSMGILFVGYFVLPVTSLVYIPAFVTGMSFHRRNGLQDKIIDVLSCLLIFRILESYILDLISFISVGVFLLIDPYFALFVGAVVAVCVLWLLHIFLVGQSKGSRLEWLFCHFLGSVFFVLLSFFAVSMLIIIPGIISLFVYVVLLFILPLPHLMTCHRTYRRHSQADGSPSDTMWLPNRLPIAAALLILISIGTAIATDGQSPEILVFSIF